MKKIILGLIGISFMGGAQGHSDYGYVGLGLGSSYSQMTAVNNLGGGFTTEFLVHI